MSAGYEKAIRDPDHGVPHAQVCFDPFHVVSLGSKAADQVRRVEYNQLGRSSSSEGKWIKGTRYSLLKDTAKQTPRQLLKLAEVVLTNKRMYRAFLLYGELRYIYKLPKHEAPERLDAWLAWGSRVRCPQTDGLRHSLPLRDAQPRPLIAPTPLDHRRLRAPHPLTDSLALQALRGAQPDPRTLDHPPLRAHRAHYPLELHTILRGHLDLFDNAHRHPRRTSRQKLRGHKQDAYPTQRT